MKNIPASRKDTCSFAGKNVIDTGTSADEKSGFSVLVKDMRTSVSLGFEGIRHGLNRVQDILKYENITVTAHSILYAANTKKESAVLNAPRDYECKFEALYRLYHQYNRLVRSCQTELSQCFSKSGKCICKSLEKTVWFILFVDELTEKLSEIQTGRYVGKRRV